MNVNKDYKRDVDREFSEMDYVGHKMFGRGLLIVLLLVVLCSIGGFGAKMFNTNADRVVFKQSITYNEGMLDDLAKYQYEMLKETDPVAKAAIADLVVNRFANFDESKIENMDLKYFLDNCKSGAYAVKGE